MEGLKTKFRSSITKNLYILYVGFKSIVFISNLKIYHSSAWYPKLKNFSLLLNYLKEIFHDIQTK